MKTSEYDPARYLTRPEAQAELLADARDSKDPEYMAEAQAVVDRARALAARSIFAD
jgi:DNA-binding phage protein